MHLPRLVAMLSCVSLFASVACGDADTGAVGTGEDEANAVSAPSIGGIPIEEVSGLGLRKARGGLELLALGDRTRAVVTASLPASGPPRDLDFKVVDLESAVPPALRPASAAQWEGIASDGAGRVFVLEENPGRVFVFDIDGPAPVLLHWIDLSVSQDRDLEKDWKADPNSRGEGLVLLRDGHVLLLKEKNPRRIVEFGPAGDAPSGLRSPEDLAADHPFQLPPSASSKMEALKVWELKDREHLPDVSELAIGQGSALWVLSDEGRSVARVEGTLDPQGGDGADLNLQEHFGLPRAIEKPEGLVVLPDGTMLVASDVPCSGRSCSNLFHVTPPGHRSR